MSKNSYPCTRCVGKGRLAGFSHVQGGVCFKCGGTGTQGAKPPKPSVSWEVRDASGSHVYNKRARSAAEAIRKAEKNWVRANEAWQAKHPLGGWTATETTALTPGN